MTEKIITGEHEGRSYTYRVFERDGEVTMAVKYGLKQMETVFSLGPPGNRTIPLQIAEAIIEVATSLEPAE